MAMTWTRATSVRASSSLAAGASATHDIDVETKYRTVLTFINTPGGTVASTRGVKCEALWSYGSTPTPVTLAQQILILASAAASTLESGVMVLEPGKYRIRVTNLDASNAVTLEINQDTLDTLS